MSEIKQELNPTNQKVAKADETDWAAAKAHYENLKSKKPRPVSNFLMFQNNTCYISCRKHFSNDCFSQPKPINAVTIAVSSRTLFDMVKERKVFEEEGLEKYVEYQQEHENEPLQPGSAFPFVKVRNCNTLVYVKYNGNVYV